MKSSPRPKALRRFLSIIIPMIGLGLVIVAILELGRYFSSDILYQVVQRETNGYYQLSYDKLDFDVWERVIQIENIVLTPDSTRDLTAAELNNLYSLEVASVLINLESITSIYFDKELLIENVRIVDPELRMIRNSMETAQSFSLQTGNLYNKISTYLQVLSIGQFSAENASFKHYPSLFSLGQTDILIRNLVMDSTSRPDQRFFSENIELEIRNQSFPMQDSLHQVSFESFLLSTADSILTFKNFRVKPDSTVLTNRVKRGDYVIYDITIPELQLRGIDYFSAYRKDLLEMEELAIINPIIKMDDETYTNPGRRNSDNSLFKIITGIFEEVQIGRLRSINTQLDLTTNKAYYDYRHIESERAHFVLYNVNLNTDNHDFAPHKRYFDNIEVIVNDYYAQLADSIHSLSFDQFELSSIDSTLIFQGFAINNNGAASGSTKPLYTLDFPLLAIDGMDYQQALTGQNLIMNQVTLNSPRLTVTNLGQQQSKAPSVADLHQSLEGAFQTVQLNKLNLYKGALKVGDGLTAGDINMEIAQLKIDETTTSVQQITEDFNLKLRELVFHTDKADIRGNSVEVNHSFDELNLQQWSINYLDSAASVTGTLDSLHLTGVNMDSLLAGDYTAFDSLLLFSPVMDIQLSQLGGNGDHPLHDKFVQVVDGELTARLDSTSLAGHEINLTFSLEEDLSLKGHLSNLEIYSPASGHQVTISQIDMPEGHLLHLDTIMIKPLGRGETPIQLYGEIPALDIYGFDQLSLINENHLKADSLSIDTPVLDVRVMPSDRQKAPAKNPLKVSMAKITLNKAIAAVTGSTTGQVNQLSSSQLSVQLRDFRLPDHDWIGPQSLLASKSVELVARDLQPVMLNGDSLFIQSIIYDSQSSLLEIDTVAYTKADQSISLLIPDLELTGLDLDSLINHDHLRFDQSELNMVNFTSYKRGNSAEQVTLASANLKVGSYSAPVNLEQRGWLNHAQSVVLEGSGFNVPMPDYHSLQVSRYGYHQEKQRLTLHGIDYQSDLTPEEYRTHLTHQKDWFDLRADSISLNGLDLANWLINENYFVRKIDIDGLHAVFYRDKTLPLPENRRVALPQSIFLNLEPRVYIDTLQTRGDIIYQEKLRDNNEVGEMTFNDLNASLLYLTTVDSLATKPMRLLSSGNLMNIAPFEAAVTLNMQDPEDAFTFIGEVNELPLGELNKLFVPLAGINVKSGYSKRVLFNIKANDNVAKGQMRLRYNNLKIQILNPETHDKQGLGQGIKTFFANTFAVKNNNPTFLVLRNGKIFYERDHSKSIFNFWGKAILSGAVSSVGIHKSRKAERHYEKEPRKE